MLRKLILIILSASILILSGLLLWVWNLNLQIKDSLAKKSFLPPTTFYSAPIYFTKNDLINLTAASSIMENHQYRLREAQQNLSDGDYFIGTNKETCKNYFESHPFADNSFIFEDEWNSLLPSGATEESLNLGCLIFRAKMDQKFTNNNSNQSDLANPNIKNTSEKDSSDKDTSVRDTRDRDTSESVLFFNSDQILQIWVDRKPEYRTELEPQMLAQFLENQPIMQSYTSLGNTPPMCLNAVLAIEDSQFLEHQGVSWTGILRAAISNLLGRHRQGGSTITQQMVKNYFLTSERTLKRKFIEFFMALILESHASKDEIIETYLNIIYMGQNGPFQVRGFGAAAQYYFQKPLTDLNVPECALLAAVLNGPGVYDPFRKPENTLKRRKLVLERMKNLNYINDSEFVSATEFPLPFQKNEILAETAPYFLNAATKQLKDLGYDLNSKEFLGAHVYTSLRTDIQAVAQSTVAQQLSLLEKENKKIKSYLEQGHKIESSVLIADNISGEIVAVVGGRNYKMTQFNRAIDGHRQVGSIMKPMVYLTALRMNSEKYLPLTVLKDEKITYKYEGQTWSPENYGKKYFGEVPMYYALKNSLNAATAFLAMEIGIKNVIETAQAFKIQSKLENVPSLSLGAFEMYPMEVLRIYQTLARMGQWTENSFVKKMTDANGKIIFQFKPKTENVMDAASVATLVSMMKHTTKTGTAKSISASGLKSNVAGKTGTTSEYKDAWFAGFSKNYTGVVWIGYDNNLPTGLTGGGTSVPIWTNIFKKLEEHRPVEDFAWPENSGPYKVWTKDDGVDTELEFVKKN